MKTIIVHPMEIVLTVICSIAISVLLTIEVSGYYRKPPTRVNQINELREVLKATAPLDSVHFAPMFRADTLFGFYKVTFKKRATDYEFIKYTGPRIRY